MKRLGDGKKWRQTHPPLAYFLSCFPELYNHPGVMAYLSNNPEYRQMETVPLGTQRARNRGKICKRLISDQLFKAQVEAGIVHFVEIMAEELNRIPTIEEIDEECRKYKAALLSRFINRCYLFDGRTRNILSRVRFTPK